MKELSNLLEQSLTYLIALKADYESKFLGLYRFRKRIKRLQEVIENLETVFYYMTMQDDLEITIERGTTNEVILEPINDGPKKVQ